MFVNASDQYSTWDLAGANVIGGGAIGSPGANWSYEGIADFNGNHLDSILFHNSSTGAYESWQMNDTAVLATHALGSPGAGWTFKAVT